MWKKKEERYKTIKCQKCGGSFWGYWNKKFCKVCVIKVRAEQALKSYYKHHEIAKKRSRKYHHKFVLEKDTKPDIYKKWRKQRTEYGKKYSQKIRLEVLKKYGGNPPKCACCKEKEIKFLTIDHIKNDGAEHRLMIGSGKLYQWLYKKRKMPKRFQVLCWNCNLSKYHYGKCPHQN